MYYTYRFIQLFSKVMLESVQKYHASEFVLHKQVGLNIDQNCIDFYQYAIFFKVHVITDFKVICIFKLKYFFIIHNNEIFITYIKPQSYRTTVLSLLLFLGSIFYVTHALLQLWSIDFPVFHYRETLKCHVSEWLNCSLFSKIYLSELKPTCATGYQLFPTIANYFHVMMLPTN